MFAVPEIALIEELTKGPLPLGSNVLVEYDSASQWYAASFTIATKWLKTGGRVSYCVAIRSPDTLRSHLSRLGLQPEELERKKRLMIYDWYTTTLGQKSAEEHAVDSLKARELDEYFAKEWMRIPSSPDLLRVTDDISCLSRFNEDKEWVEIFLSRGIPSTTRAKSTTIRGIITGVHSDWVYKTLEASVDAIIDFKLREEGKAMRDFMRIRSLRNVAFDSQWYSLDVDENFEVTLDKSRQAVVLSERATMDTPEARRAHSLIVSLDVVTLSRYRVLGNCVRFEESVRNALKDAKQNIVAGFNRPTPKYEVHLIWASPGSGKTYFVQEVAQSLKNPPRYYELNLARLDEHEFRNQLAQLGQTKGPCLTFVDEVDAKPNESWPYEALLPYSDSVFAKGAGFVLVLAGSSTSSLEEMRRKIGSRNKGTDLLSRIPTKNQYVIPPVSLGDRVIMLLSIFRQVGKEMNHEISGVEKLGLYYAALSPRLGNPRQLRELAVRSIEHVPIAEERVKYDCLFDVGDPENKSFWAQAAPVSHDLVNRFVRLED